MKPSRTFDLVILGGGIAGMTAAIFAARANLKTVILEERVCGGLANWAHIVENFPSHISISGMELMDRVLVQVKHLGVVVDEAAKVESVEMAGFPKRIETEEAVYTAKAIILATGRQPIKLKLNTDCERIHYCAVCDGSAYAGKKVVVVGGGDSAFGESLYLLSLGVTRILLVEALENCCASEITQAKLRSHANVDIRTSSEVIAVAKEGNGCRVTLEDRAFSKKEAVYSDGVFVFIGQKSNNELFRDLIDLDGNGYILAGPNRETNLSGVYAAGDVVQKDYRYLTTAMADGSIAALAAARFIREVQ